MGVSTVIFAIDINTTEIIVRVLASGARNQYIDIVTVPKTPTHGEGADIKVEADNSLPKEIVRKVKQARGIRRKPIPTGTQ